MEIKVQKTGGIWHGYVYVDGKMVADERGLTEEIARRKAESVVERRRGSGQRGVRKSS